MIVDTFKTLPKEERLYIMASVLFFNGFAPAPMSSGEMWMTRDVLSLTEEEIKNFPIPDYETLISHVKSIKNEEMQDWIITNTYKYILRSRRNDAEPIFKLFTEDLGWDKNLIRATIELARELNS